MVAHSALGLTGAPFDLAVERGKIWEFARALHAHDLPEHHGPEAVSPPTFFTTQFFWEAQVEGAAIWEAVEMSQERGMHAEQEYIFHGPPPRAGELLRAQSRITDIWEKPSRSAGKLTFVRMVTTFHDADGRLRAEAILTGVETSLPPTAPPAPHGG